MAFTTALLTVTADSHGCIFCTNTAVSAWNGPFWQQNLRYFGEIKKFLKAFDLFLLFFKKQYELDFGYGHAGLVFAQIGSWKRNF